MSEKSPAVQWFVKQALGDDKILAMDWDARGMHWWLLNISWQQEPPGTIPDDDAVIRRWLGSPSEDIWRRVRPQIMTAWPVQDGRRANAGMVRAAARQKAYSESRAAAAKARWDAHADAHAVREPMRKPCESTKDKDEESFSLFEKAYEEYPRHIGKRAAEKAWGHAIDREAKKRVAPLAEHEGVVFQKVKQFSEACKRTHKPAEYTPHMATWLNQDRFLDDPSEWEVTSNGKPPVSLREQKLELERTIGSDRRAGAYIADPDNPNGLTPEQLEYARKINGKAKGAGA